MRARAPTSLPAPAPAPPPSSRRGRGRGRIKDPPPLTQRLVEVDAQRPRQCAAPPAACRRARACARRGAAAAAVSARAAPLRLAPKGPSGARSRGAAVARRSERSALQKKEPCHWGRPARQQGPHSHAEGARADGPDEGGQAGDEARVGEHGQERDAAPLRGTRRRFLGRGRGGCGRAGVQLRTPARAYGVSWTEAAVDAGASGQRERGGSGQRLLLTQIAPAAVGGAAPPCPAAAAATAAAATATAGCLGETIAIDGLRACRGARIATLGGVRRAGRRTSSRRYDTVITPRAMALLGTSRQSSRSSTEALHAGGGRGTAR